MKGTKHKKLTKLFDSLKPPLPFNPQEDKYVIFSDQHIGMAEFDGNKDLYLKALAYYYKSEYKMIVVGDYEELHRYGIKELKQKYDEVYAVERKFLEEDRYFRIFGNHDIDWNKPKRVRKHLHDVMPGLEIVEAIKFSWNGNFIFLTHGHQGNFINDNMGIFGRIVLRYIARPLGISSLTSPAKRYTLRRKDENKYYEWAKENKVLFIAGHTHRPMFESLTKADRMQIEMESLIRKYVSTTAPDEKQKIEDEIIKLKADFERVRKEEGEKAKWTGLGQPCQVVPCYSNDGSCLHGNGITCIELCDGKMRLSLLYDEKIEANKAKYMRAGTADLLPSDPDAAGYKKQILEEEELDYIFTRIRLLS